MPLMLTDAERAMWTRWPRRSRTLAVPSLWARWRKSLRPQVRLQSGQVQYTGPRAPSYEVSGPRRRTLGRAGWGLEVLGAKALLRRRRAVRSRARGSGEELKGNGTSRRTAVSA
jgi:hypothetical protein